MKYRSALLRALGASMLAALALTAIAASSAQASGNGLFLVNLSTITSFPLKISASVGAGTLLAWGLDIECSSGVFAGNLTAAAHGSGIATFKECKAPGATVCLVTNKEITTSTLLVELKLLGTIVRLTAPSGTFVSVNFLSHEEECAFGVGHEQTHKLTGEACATVSGDTLTLIKGASAHCPNGMKCGPNSVAFDAPNSALVEDLGQKVTTHA